MTNTIKGPNGLKFSPRTKLRLTELEMSELREFTHNNLGSFSTIRENTNVHPETIRAGLERGWFEAKHAFKIRDFLKKLKLATT